MANSIDHDDQFVLRFTPAEWHGLLEDRSFLNDPDNGDGRRRRLMGLPVQIVPDHRFDWRCATQRRTGT